jgi:tRNA threonylcarbamoyladenosine biosynthesis protein TsaE
LNQPIVDFGVIDAGLAEAFFGVIELSKFCGQSFILKTPCFGAELEPIMRFDEEISLATEADTQALGRDLAALLRPGDCVCLKGDLGAGKTTLARAIIQERAGADVEAPSPTFTLVQTYETEGAAIWHMDLYRLKRPEEIYELGFEEALDEGVLLIEWPEKAAGLLPAVKLEVHLQIDHKKSARSARFSGDLTWRQRLDAENAP